MSAEVLLKYPDRTSGAINGESITENFRAIHRKIMGGMHDQPLGANTLKNPGGII